MAPHAAAAKGAGGGGGVGGMSRSQLRKAVRDTERLLSRDSLDADKRVAAERKLQALKVQLDDTPSSAIERASQQRYRMVKFFERRKIERQLASARREAAAEGPDGEAAARVSELELDLHYVSLFPKTHRYIALRPPTPTTDPKVIAARDSLREQIRDALARGVEPDAIVLRVPPNTVKPLVNPLLRPKPKRERAAGGDASDSEGGSDGDSDGERDLKGDDASADEQVSGSASESASPPPPPPRKKASEAKAAKTVAPRTLPKLAAATAEPAQVDGARAPRGSKAALDGSKSEPSAAKKKGDKDKKRAPDVAGFDQDDFFSNAPTELPAQRKQYIVTDAAAETEQYGSRRAWNELKRNHQLNHRGELRKAVRKELTRRAPGPIIINPDHASRPNKKIRFDDDD